ncbi:MAG: hypothetical protein GX173_09130 [Ruminococcaceae bacterium]|nr:hypothetical protein [Oscillospiraceae bacterium]
MMERIRQILDSGSWGTIGPYSQQAAALLAHQSDAKYALLTHSAGSSLEALLRSVGVCHGDRVLVPAHGTRIVTLSPKLTGAQAVTCGHLGRKVSLSDVETAVHDKPEMKCAVLEYGRADQLDEIYAFFQAKKIVLILWSGGNLFAEHKDQSICRWADAVVYSFAEGSVIYAGNAGALLTNCRKIFEGAFAAHNCGRIPGEGATLEFNDAIGGNMRITEWQSAIIFEKLSERAADKR